MEKIDDQQINLKKKGDGLKIEEVDEDMENMESKKKTKKVNEASNEWDQLNQNRPLWTLKSEDMMYNKCNTTP
eukprot:8412969-Heterocapsa_arctica.AAC.1